MAERYGVSKRTMPPKLSLEGYLHFIRAEKRLDLTVDHLNQIIHMHGFKKFRRTPKSILVEVVGRMELMDPARSTIQDDGVSSGAFLTLDDVIKDLEQLKWQECCVTSIQTFSHHYDGHQHESLGSGGGGCSVGSIVSASSEKQPKKQRRKRGKLTQLANGDVEKEAVSPRVNTGSSETPVLENWSPPKKRTVKYADVIGSGIRAPSPLAAGEVQPSS